MTGSHFPSLVKMLFGSAFALAMVAGCASTDKAERPRVIADAPTANPHEKIGKPYKVAGIWYYPARDDAYDASGIASWYGPKFHGKKTANGEIFDMNRLTAAHPTLPLPSIVQVTNLKNGRTVNVRLNDRGPFAHNRIIDMSREAADRLGFKDDGLAEVRVRYIGPAGLDSAITALGELESYADGTYAMPRTEAVMVSAGQGDTVRTRLTSGPEIKIDSATTPAESLNRETMRAARASVARTERQVVEEIVTGTAPLDTDRGATLPDFNKVMETIGATPADDVWMVQIGAYSSARNAQTAAANFGQTIPVHEEHIVNTDGSALTLVRLGPYRTAEEAAFALDMARHSGFRDAHIVGP